LNLGVWFKNNNNLAFNLSDKFNNKVADSYWIQVDFFH